jgi:hypothetical protein
MKTDANKFRLKGEDILKKETSRPQSINSFLNDQKEVQVPSDAQKHKIQEPQRCRDANPQIHNSTLAQLSKFGAHVDAVERIHVQIRKDLADRLIKMVYSRKLSKKRASQRGIIEQALEEFFDRHNS